MLAVSTAGATPAQTISYELQQLREAGEVMFSARGQYLYRGVTVDPIAEDLEDDELDFGFKHNTVTLPDIVGDTRATEEIGQARLRRGKQKLRESTLANYGYRCALCDISDEKMLVASHIARWADRPEARANLTNTISMCVTHDKLFEVGYLRITDDYQVIRTQPECAAVRCLLMEHTGVFRVPFRFPPAVEFLREHRTRVSVCDRCA